MSDLRSVVNVSADTHTHWIRVDCYTNSSQYWHSLWSPICC